MLAYSIRRVFQSIVVLLVVGLVAFSMFRFVGDPIDNMLGQERTDADIERLRGELGLDQPFVVQYGRFLTNAASGNLGVSYRQGRPVADILMERAPATPPHRCRQHVCRWKMETPTIRSPGSIVATRTTRLAP